MPCPASVVYQPLCVCDLAPVMGGWCVCGRCRLKGNFSSPRPELTGRVSESSWLSEHTGAGRSPPGHSFPAHTTHGAAHIHTHMCTPVHAHTHTHTYTCARTTHGAAHIHTHTHTCTPVHARTHTHTHTYTCARTNTRALWIFGRVSA